MHTLVQEKLGRTTDGKALIDIFFTELRLFYIELRTSGNGVLVDREKTVDLFTAFYLVGYTGRFFGFG